MNRKALAVFGLAFCVVVAFVVCLGVCQPGLALLGLRSFGPAEGVSAASTAGSATGDSVVVGAGETIDDDAFLAGRSVTVKGTVTGDLVAAGDNVVADGDVRGDALLAGRSVTVRNTVGGDARLAAQDITVGAQIDGNLMFFAQTGSISASTHVGRNLTAACQTLDIDGAVAGKARVGGGVVTVNGKVGKDLIVEASNLIITDSAEIGGDVRFTGERPAEIAPGAKIHGEVRFTPLPTAPAVPPARRALQVILNLIKFVVLGALLALFAAKGVRTITDVMAERALASFGVGVVSVIAVPVVLVILGVVIVGASAAWVLGAAFTSVGIVALFAFKVLVAVLVGRLILKRARKGQEPPLLHAALLGTVIVFVVTLVPVIDFAVAVLGALLTLGALLIALKDSVLSWPGGRGPAQA